MAGEIKRVYGTVKTLEASGASIATTAIGVADDELWATADTGDFPDAIFVLTCAFGGTPTAGTTIDLILMPHDIDGTTDAVVPTATYRNHYFGSFLPSTSASQTLYLEVANLPKAGRAYIYNNSTGQTLSTGWTLKLTPLSLMATA
jgi:hypothetical protein